MDYINVSVDAIDCICNGNLNVFLRSKLTDFLAVSFQTARLLNWLIDRQIDREKQTETERDRDEK